MTFDDKNSKSLLELTAASACMSPSEFANFGDGQLTYVRPMTSKQFETAFPDAPEIPGGLKIWALLNANGSPIVVGDSRDVVISNAWEHELEPMSVH